jgi:hypothetical protein
MQQETQFKISPFKIHHFVVSSFVQQTLRKKEREKDVKVN